jgi:hypothetical protein
MPSHVKTNEKGKSIFPETTYEYRCAKEFDRLDGRYSRGKLALRSESRRSLVVVLRRFWNRDGGRFRFIC